MVVCREKSKHRSLFKSREAHNAVTSLGSRTFIRLGLDQNTKFLLTRSCEPSWTNLPMTVHGSNSFDYKVSCNSLYRLALFIFLFSRS